LESSEEQIEGGTCTQAPSLRAWTIGVAKNLCCWGPDNRGDNGVEIERASRGKGMGIPPQPTGGLSLGSFVSSPSGVRGKAPVEDEFWPI